MLVLRQRPANPSKIFRLCSAYLIKHRDGLKIQFDAAGTPPVSCWWTTRMDTTALVELTARYKADPESVYNTWFINGAERMKAFRAIRRGVKDTVDAIAAGTFGNDFKGSSLEFVLTAITEQKQVFEGAAHPFYWKPKLRIPDIYENQINKQKFGAFLQACLTATREDQVLAEMSRLGGPKSKDSAQPLPASFTFYIQLSCRRSTRRWSMASTRCSPRR